MSILTLTTDWGLRDHYLAAFKGELLSQCPGIQLVDISHQVDQFDILQASFILRNCFWKFPRGTLHFVGISASHNRNKIKEPRRYIIIKCRDHFFIGEDSGIFSLVLGDTEKEIYKLQVTDNPSLPEVHELFLDVITQFQSGKKPEEIGERTEVLTQSYHAQPAIDSNSIRGAIIYIDAFGNMITNVDITLFEKVADGRKFVIYVRSSYDIRSISKSYTDAEPGEIVALFNSEGSLKLAINQNKASSLLGMKVMDTFRIEFT